MKTVIFKVIVASFLIWSLQSCTHSSPAPRVDKELPEARDTLPKPEPYLFNITVDRDVKIKDYFKYMDGLVAQYDSLVPYDLNEYLLVGTNPWLIDTLASTDYYLRKCKGDFVFDQRQLVVLHLGDQLKFPNDSLAAAIKAKQAQTWLDLNIPEFKMRVVEGKDTVFSFPVRVGQKKQRFLEVAGHDVDLRTHPGEGSIVRVNRYPDFVNPVDGKKYKATKRDDGQYTKMPQIPWLEPELNGRRLGQLIHPTTNPETLGKAYSNGCVGCGEADAWRVYYYAPIGTKVVFRYDLMMVSPKGDTTYLKDIYNLSRKIRD